MKQPIISLLMMLLPLMANAEEVEIDGIYYNLINKAKVAEVTWSSNGYTGDVVIPSSVVYNDVTYPVTAIGDYAFHWCSGLTSITIPNSVTAIGTAFMECTSLTGVYITDLDAWCKIESAVYYSNPLSYAHHLYLNGKEIKELVIPNSVTSIRESAFSGCSGLTSVTIPNSVTTIGSCAFERCSNLTSITIPNSVTSIGGSAFYECTGLTSITIPNSVTSIGSSAFAECSNLTSITIPNSITFIGDDAFRSCSGLTSVTIPNSVTSIGDYSFGDCSSLTSVTIPNSVTYIGDRAFCQCSGLTSVTIPNSVTAIGEYAFWGCSCLISVTIPNSVTSIGNNAFEGCSGLTSVIIPNSVTYIRDGAFWGCSGLTSVTISNSVTSIGSNAFAGCSGLTSVTIPNSVTSIGQYAFRDCIDLTSVSIGSAVKHIYGAAFANCPELTDVYCYAENVPNTYSDAFYDSYIEFATLHVPASALNAYSNTEPWSKFKNKVGMGDVKPSYTLSYMLDGTKYREYSFQEGEAITPVPAPTKEGFTFSGWSEIPETMPDHDVTVTGTFIANTYLPGDANGDGQITVTDIGVIVDIILGKTTAGSRKMQQETEPQ